MKRKTYLAKTLPFLALLLISHSTLASKNDQRIHGTVSLKGKSKNEYTALAKLSLQEAIAKVTVVAPGKLVEIVLEEEDGFLIYEAEVVGTDSSRKEIIVDAGNGEILLVKEKTRKKA